MYYVISNNLNHRYLFKIPQDYIFYARFLLFEKLGIKKSVEEIQQLINSELRKGFIKFKEQDKEGTNSTVTSEFVNFQGSAKGPTRNSKNTKGNSKR